MSNATLLIGNLFSLLSSICIAVSVIKRSKKDFMLWQIGDTFWGMLTNVTLNAQAALMISIVCFIRNLLSYKNRLTGTITAFLLVLSVFLGAWANNLGLIGWLPIVASAGYTFCIYLTKNEQQMRYALLLNMALWFVHNFYVQAYPSALSNVLLCGWSGYHIIKNHHA